MNILLTSAGRRTYMIRYFKNALKGLGLVHASNSVFTYALTQADKYIITPLNISLKLYKDMVEKYCIDNSEACKTMQIEKMLPISSGM